MTPGFYQKLLDRCWRRSGSLLYRPDQKNACCPHYTLRLDSTQFKPTKDQRQAINRFNKYVTGDHYAKEAARLYPRSKQDAKRRDNEFNLVERIHEAEWKFLKTPPEPEHDFVVTLEVDKFTEEKYEVYANYQRVVHKEPPEKISMSGFRRFLCNSPLRREAKIGENGKPMRLGSYHQCYRLDGKLVAVGVLDLLPHCVSAVYFFYHEDIHEYNPGKLGALREIALALEGGYRYWYSGYYIHTCPKMRYKMDYSPQFVLDPETLTWDLVDNEVLALFDKFPYLSVSRHRKLLATEGGTTSHDSPSSPSNNTDATQRGFDLSRDMVSATEEEDEDDTEEDDFLLTSNMPGIPSLAQMREVDMDSMLVRSDHAASFFLTSDLVVWSQQDIANYPCIKSKVAELVAVVGPDLTEEFCLDFRLRHRG